MVAIFSPRPAFTQIEPLLDAIRNVDLNDYALGVAVATSQSGYKGSDSNSYLYPYLSTRTNPAFTDYRLIATEGEIGLRYLTDNNWTLGVLGRVEMRSLEADEDLPGISERKATLELAPAVGYRGWPLHIGFKTFFEILDRHEGSRSQLELSFPIEVDRGFIIPSLELNWNSEEYNAYYYGIDSEESSLALSVYESDAGLNPRFKVTWGYELSERWLIRGRIAIELLDDEISDSPLMDDDQLWSATLGFDYNANIFQPRTPRFDPANRPKSEIRISLFNDNIDTQLKNNNVNGLSGNKIDLEDLLGLSDKETVTQIDGLFRIADYHRIEVSYQELDRSGQAVLSEDVRFGAEQFLNSTDLRSSTNTETMRLTYGYSLLLSSQAEFGVKAGLHKTRIETEFIAQNTMQSEESDVSPLLPVLGAFGSVYLGAKTTLVADAQVFGMDFNNYDGSIISIRTELQYDLGSIALGLGYSFYGMNLRSKKDSLSGKVEFRHHGPSLSAAFRF